MNPRDDIVGRPVPPPPKKRRILSFFSAPRWFKKGFWIWLAFILTVSAVAYCRYSFGPDWTPDHLIQIFKIGI